MPATRGSAVRRRRAFVALVAVLAIGATVLLLTPRDGTVDAAPTSPVSLSATGATGTPTDPPPPADTTMPPAWLAWISGSLPQGFARAAASTPALGTTVVVAGDTRWMTWSHDANGADVDRPTPPYEIPIDAFAVAPDAYAPFVPDAFRDSVRRALADGEAVLGETSATLRRLDVGGALVFDTQEVTVGAVVPDRVAGWSEMLVSRDVGRALGIADERYLLSLPVDAMTGHRFAETIARLLPTDPARTLPPGGSRYMRIASGVNPPVLAKTIFGEFSATPRTDDPAFLDIDPAWTETHIDTRTVPLLGEVTCNVALFPALVAALEDVEAAGLGSAIHTYSGCWAARTVARSSTAPPSEHAYGAAIDINAPESPYGAPPNFDLGVVAIFEAHGFNWGGHFLTPDGHHFEWGLSTPPRG